MKKYGYTEQEEVVAHYLTEKGIAFERQKRMIGYGHKTWVIDFFLPQLEILLECKETAQQGVEDNTTMAIAVYKDFFKLDELGKRYNLSKVVLIKTKKIRKSLINNATAHNIYILSDISQIDTVIQALNITKRNLDVLAEINKTEYIIREKPKKKTFSTLEEKCAYLYAKGSSMDKIGQQMNPPKHRFTVARLLRKYLSKHFNNKEIENNE